MRRGRAAAFVAALTTSGLTACGRGDSRASASSAGGAAPAAGSTAVAPPPSPCILADLWSVCTVEKRLESMGLIARLQDSAQVLPMFSRPARHYDVGRGELWVVLYPDTLSRARDAAQLDTVRVARPGQVAGWKAPPTFVQSRNVAVVLVTGSELLTVRIQDAFTAGLPTLQRR